MKNSIQRLLDFRLFGNHQAGRFAGLIFIILAALSAVACSESVDGSDADPETAPARYEISSQADFDALEAVVFNGGDLILLQRGRSFEGALSLKRSDLRPSQVITVSDFGSATDPRPVIRADVERMGAIDIRDSGGWTIENLELVNQSDVRSTRHGIYVTAEDSGTHRNFVVRNCFVHDVTGAFKDFNNGGIIFRVTGEKVPTNFDGVLIENNEIRRISGVGIRTKSTWESGPEDPRGLKKLLGRHAHLNVIVRGNRVSHVTRNAIIVGSADAPLLEYNVMGPAIATETTGNTLYTYATTDAVVQFNEAFGNHGPAEDIDHGGFDADYGSRNTEFRYNYSHDNNFAFAIMRKYLNGTRIHHNISVNDRFGFIHYGFGDAHAITDLVISNNTFYSSNPDMNFFMNHKGTREAIDTTLVDNIFVFAGEGASWGSVPTHERGMVLDNNIVIGLDDPENIELSDDPVFASPGDGGSEVDMHDPDRLKGYRLCKGSPAIDTGKQGDNEATADFWGDEITNVNIGAYGGPGVECGDKPNVLFIAIDDLNDWVGYTGVNPSTITPNIDALAENGTAFTNAFTQYPVCGPSRASLYSGLLPGTIGFTSQPKDPAVARVAQELGTPLLHSYFAQNGYKTMAVGKLLHRHIPEGSVDESGGRGDWDRLEDGERLNWDTDRTMTDWGVYPYPEEEMSDPMAAKWAVERLQEEHDKPFMLMVGFLRPHVPWYVPQRWFDAMGDAGKLILPPYKPDDLEDVPDYAVATNIAQGYPRTEWAIENGQWNDIVQAYLASVHFVDHYVGQVLDALEKSPYADNTVVVLWSDHGYHVGEKNTFQKHSLWERSGKVPLIVSGPGVPTGETRDQAVGLIDIYPTLLDLAGLPENPVNEGNSLKPLLENDSADWDNPVITQWRRNRDNWDRRGQAVQLGHWRYSLYGDGSEELYNHADDPNEWTNLAASPETAGEHRELMDRLKAYLPAEFYTFEPRSSSG